MTDKPIPPFKLLTAIPIQADAKTPVLIRHDYEVCTIEYVVDGAGFVELDRHPRARVEADGVYFLHKHSNHRYYPDREHPWSKLFFVVDGALMEYLLKSYDLDQCVDLPKVPELKRFFIEFIELQKHTSDSTDAAALLFHEFVLTAARLRFRRQSPPAADTPAARLKQQLETTPGEPFRLGTYAAGLGVAPAVLIRQFRRAYGLTPIEYRLKLRLAEAERLLAYSELSIKEIAALLGFSDQYYFSNCFRHHFRISPSSFRRSGR